MALQNTRHYSFATLFAFVTYSILLLLTIAFTLNSGKSVEALKFDNIATGLKKSEILYSAIADQFYDELLEDQQVLHWMEEANQATPAIRAEIRKQLIQKLSPLYERMTRVGVKQFHLHLADESSFIRFHGLDKWGDCLRGIRATIDRTHDTRKITRGFEQGRIFSGFRNVYPLLSRHDYIGSVEISFGLSTLVQSIVFKDALATTVIENKHILGRKLFDDMRHNYRCTIYCDDYWEDLSKPAIFPVTPRDEALIWRINQDLASADLGSRLAAGRSFIVHTLYRATLYETYFYPLKNWLDEFRGYVVVFTRPSEAPRILGLALLFFVLFTSLLMFFLKYAKRKEEEIYILMDNDPLTGILNRRRGLIQTEKYVNLIRRTGGRICAVFVDIDHFKAINDACGHAVGDRILCDLADCISRNVRNSDLIYRYGGEEFVIILPETGLEGACKIAEKLRFLVESETFNIPAKLTVSLGVAEKKDNESIQSWLDRADSAMYEAKAAGRNRVRASRDG